jgi:hypothetical protein
MDLARLRGELQKEIRDLELEKARLEERLAEKQRTLTRLGETQGVNGGGSLAPRPMPNPGRKTITALGPHHYEIGTLRLRNPGEILDHFNHPHYFSKKNPRKNDGAAREILRWAKQNPAAAHTVRVVFPNGNSRDLWTAVTLL